MIPKEREHIHNGQLVDGDSNHNRLEGGDDVDAGDGNAVNYYNDHNDNQGLPELMGPHDPRRMWITRQEQLDALDIKQAIIATPQLDNLSDFRYAQLAIVCKEDVADALHQARSLQAFRQEYKIEESYPDGCSSLSKILELLPKFLLSFTFSIPDGTWASVHDNIKIDTTVFTAVARRRYWFAGAFYTAHAFFPDLESMRKGLIALVECQGMDWTQKQDFRLIRDLFSQLWSMYPFTGILKHYHTGVIFNVMAAMLRKTLPGDMKHRLQTGLVHENRLDSVFLIPTAEVATQRILQTMQAISKSALTTKKNFRCKMKQLWLKLKRVDYCNSGLTNCTGGL